MRYKQTGLGVLWALIQPVLTTVIFTFISIIMGFKGEDGIPYPIFFYVGQLFWLYFSGALTNASNSMVLNAQLISKIYFPRLIVPATAATTGLVDFAISAAILVPMMIYYGFKPHLADLLILPLLLVCVILHAMGVGLYLAAVNVKYRDVRYAVPFIIQLMFFMTPIMFSAQKLNGHPLIKNLMLWLNPVSGVISNARAALLGRSPVDWQVLGISLLMSFVFFVFGLYYFRNTERYFADIV
ncbi:MAG: ABC transporter permease [Armatimonadetes bacterium]|nr:ABC transporter permease [Armatimonadota bacterium]